MKNGKTERSIRQEEGGLLSEKHACVDLTMDSTYYIKYTMNHTEVYENHRGKTILRRRHSSVIFLGNIHSVLLTIWIENTRLGDNDHIDI